MINCNFPPFSQQSAFCTLPRGTVTFPHIKAFLWILKFYIYQSIKFMCSCTHILNVLNPVEALKISLVGNCKNG